MVSACRMGTIAPAKIVWAKDVRPEVLTVWRLLPRSNSEVCAFRWQSGTLARHDALAARGSAYDTIPVSLALGRPAEGFCVVL